MIKYFSTKEKSDTTMKCFNYVGCGYLDSSKLTDDNIKAFSNEVNNIIAYYEIVLTASKLNKVSDKGSIKKVTEHLCPALSKLGDELGNKLGQLGHEYLEEHTRKLIEELCLLLSNNNTFWSKLVPKNFKISNILN